jgi:hypothetical protein
VSPAFNGVRRANTVRWLSLTPPFAERMTLVAGESALWVVGGDLTRGVLFLGVWAVVGVSAGTFTLVPVHVGVHPVAGMPYMKMRGQSWGASSTDSAARRRRARTA